MPNQSLDSESNKLPVHTYSLSRDTLIVTGYEFNLPSVYSPGLVPFFDGQINSAVKKDTRGKSGTRQLACIADFYRFRGAGATGSEETEHKQHQHTC